MIVHRRTVAVVRRTVVDMIPSAYIMSARFHKRESSKMNTANGKRTEMITVEVVEAFAFRSGELLDDVTLVIMDETGKRLRMTLSGETLRAIEYTATRAREGLADTDQQCSAATHELHKSEFLHKRQQG